MLRPITQLADAEVAELFLGEGKDTPGREALEIKLEKSNPLEKLIANLRARRGERQCSRVGEGAQPGKRRRAPL